MIKFAIVLCATAVLGNPPPARAERPEDVETVRPAPGLPPVLEDSTETGLWLLVQRSGTVAGSRYAIPGKVASLTYERYLDSFKHPIPPQFAVSGRSSSGSGAASRGAAGAPAAGR